MSAYRAPTQNVPYFNINLAQSREIKSRVPIPSRCIRDWFYLPNIIPPKSHEKRSTSSSVRNSPYTYLKVVRSTLPVKRTFLITTTSNRHETSWDLRDIHFDPFESICELCSVCGERYGVEIYVRPDFSLITPHTRLIRPRNDIFTQNPLTDTSINPPHFELQVPRVLEFTRDTTFQTLPL